MRGYKLLYRRGYTHFWNIFASSTKVWMDYHVPQHVDWHILLSSSSLVPLTTTHILLPLYLHLTIAHIHLMFSSIFPAYNSIHTSQGLSYINPLQQHTSSLKIPPIFTHYNNTHLCHVLPFTYRLQQHTSFLSSPHLQQPSFFSSFLVFLPLTTTAHNLL